MFIKTVNITVAAGLAFVSIFGTILQHLCIVEELLAKLPAVRIGADVAGISKERFIARLTWIKECLRFNAFNWKDRQSFARVSHALEVLKLDNSNGSIRKQPYCVLLTGHPGCGKSNYALELAVACLKSKYDKVHPNDIVIINETDEFQSEFRSYHKVVIFDDVGAENPNIATINPWRKVIDFVNNIRKTSLNPNVEMKGNVYIQPEMVILTTNLKSDLNLRTYLNAPGAIHRRIKKLIYLENGFERAKLASLTQTSHSNSWAYNGDLTVGPLGPSLSRKVLLDSVVKEFRVHDVEQESFVANVNSLFTPRRERGALASFYDDVIYPLLPKKIYLTKEIEEIIPFHVKLARRFCVLDKQAVVFQSQMREVPQLESQADFGSLGLPGDFDSVTSPELYHYSYELDDLDFVDWDWVIPLFKHNATRYIQPDYITLYADGFRMGHQLYSKTLKTYSTSNEVAEGYTFTIERFREIIRLHEQNSEHDSSSYSDDTDDSDLSSLDDVRAFDTVSPELTDEQKEHDDFMVSHLEPIEMFPLSRMKLTRPFDNNVVSVIETAPFPFKLRAYEYSIDTMAVDLLYEYLNSRVFLIVEVKSKIQLGKAFKQASRYRRHLEKEYPKVQFEAAVFTSNSVGSTVTDPGFKRKVKIDWNRFLDYFQRWKKNYLDRCGAVDSKEKKTDTNIEDSLPEYVVNDSKFGLTIYRRSEVGDIPYDADGNFNHALFAQNL